MTYAEMCDLAWRRVYEVERVLASVHGAHWPSCRIITTGVIDVAVYDSCGIPRAVRRCIISDTGSRMTALQGDAAPVGWRTRDVDIDRLRVAVDIAGGLCARAAYCALPVDDDLVGCMRDAISYLDQPVKQRYYGVWQSTDAPMRLLRCALDIDADTAREVFVTSVLNGDTLSQAAISAARYAISG